MSFVCVKLYVCHIFFFICICLCFSLKINKLHPKKIHKILFLIIFQAWINFICTRFFGGRFSLWNVMPQWQNHMYNYCLYVVNSTRMSWCNEIYAICTICYLLMTFKNKLFLPQCYCCLFLSQSFVDEGEAYLSIAFPASAMVLTMSSIYD